MTDIPGYPGGGGGNHGSGDHGGADAGTLPPGRQAASFPPRIGPDCAVMQIHGSCASRFGDGVLLVGPPGSGKSDLVLRLLARGFDLVADDRVAIVNGLARPVPPLEGLLEVRGVGIVRLPFVAPARLALVVELGAVAQRLPMPERYDRLDLPALHLDPSAASAPERIALALECAVGRVSQVAGAFAQ